MNHHLRNAAIDLNRQLHECMCIDKDALVLCKECQAALKALKAIGDVSEQHAMALQAIDVDVAQEYKNED